MDRTFLIHLDEILMDDFPSGNKLSSAAILTHDGGVMAKSEDFPEISYDEMSIMLSGIDDPNTVATGLILGGVRYMLTPSEAGHSLRGRTLGKNGGVIIRKTWSFVVLGIYEAPVTMGEAEARVGSYADSYGDLERPNSN